MSDYLPEAMLIEIFVKLPVKSLIRATSVCKPWWSLIRSSSFISAHLSVTENQTIVRHCDLDELSVTENQTIVRHCDLDEDGREHYIVISKGGPFGINHSPELQLPFKCPTVFFRIVGSCDGLLCLYNDERCFNDDNLVKSSGPILIWNPAIRNHVVLPQPLVNLEEYDRVALGFGVSRNVYKVVRLVCCVNGHPLQAEILSLGTGKWRKLCLPKFDYRVRLFGYMDRPVFFKGFVHWSTFEAITSRNSILTFHVGDEVFSEFLLPQELERDAVTSLSLAVMGESLVAVKYGWEGSGRRCDVWMMKDYGVKESWTKLYTIDSLRFERVVGFRGRGEALAIHGCELVTYNAETKGIEYVGFSGNTQAHHVVDYRESLVLLGGYSEDSGEESSRDAARIIES